MFKLKIVWKFFILSLLPLTFSCSLNYGTEQSSESATPEFSFTDAQFNRYEDEQISINLEAEKLEQYKSDGSSYAKNAQFKTFKKDGGIDTEGFCSLLAADTSAKNYSLFDGISINIYSQELKITAQSLHFNGKTEQLTSARDEEVTIGRKGTDITGRGFSASGVSRTFAFENQVTGTVNDIMTEDDSELESETDDETEESAEMQDSAGENE